MDTYDLTIVGIYRCNSLLLDIAIVLDCDAVRKIAKMEDRFITSVYFEPDGTVSNADLIDSILARFRGRNDSPPVALNALATGPHSSLLNTAAALLQAGSTPKEPATTDASQPAVVEEALEIRSASDWGAKVQELSSDLDIFLWLMTGIGVVIALLSILNTMLMSVAERMVEFGVLKANGWSAWDILRLITWESALLGIVGGLCGCGLGWSVVQLANWLMPTKLHLYASPALLLFSLVFSTALGIVGGLYPAWWAVRMSPMEAIRRG